MSDESAQSAPRLARPYTLVGGRTRSAVPTLAIETLVWRSNDPGREAPGDSAKASILERCGNGATSLAELAAFLDAPIGVTRVLVGDLVAEGLLEAGETAGPAAESAAMEDLDLLKRVLANVERL